MIKDIEINEKPQNIIRDLCVCQVLVGWEWSLPVDEVSGPKE
jgi:hypothetical protein